jgi:DUF971 family protein
LRELGEGKDTLFQDYLADLARKGLSR